MRLFTLLFFLAIPSLHIWAQSPEEYLYKEALKPGSKPAIDFAAIEKFRKLLSSVNLSQSVISRDGRYCSYGVGQGIMLQSTENGWKQWMSGAQNGFFAGNNRQYFCQVKDSLFILPLGGGDAEVLSGVASYDVFEQGGRNEWLAIRLKDQSCILKNLLTGKKYRFSDVSSVSFSNNDWFGCLGRSGELTIVRLTTGKVSHYRNVMSYDFDKTDRVLILKIAEADSRSLQWADPLSGKIQQVWKGHGKGEEVGGYSLDDACRRLVFVVQGKQGSKTENVIWYYEKGMREAVLKVDRHTSGMEDSFELSSVPTFNNNGRYILFSLKRGQAPKARPRADAVQVDVWHYRDTFLMSSQVAKEKHPAVQLWLSESICNAVVGSNVGSKVLRLTGDHERLGSVSGDYAIVIQNAITGRFWESDIIRSLVSLRDGRRIPLRREIGAPCFVISDKNDWVFCYDRDRAQYLRYDIATGIYTNLSATIPEWLGRESEFSYPQRQDPVAPCGDILWMEGKKSVLIFDYYDIWKLDLDGKKPAINVTSGYGRRHRIRFDIVKEESIMSGDYVRNGARLLLSAVNMETKENGFYAVQLGGQFTEPEQLFMGPYLLYVGRSRYGHLRGGNIVPRKALDAQVWLMCKESATEPANLYVTHDLKRLVKLTDVKLVEKHNWLSSELVNFSQQDGSKGCGVLYRPEDFDKRKKYPVLIHYYQHESLKLNEYLLPGYTANAHIDIPWFVSRGYIVFVPDIYYTKATSGASALNTVEGAASWLAKQTYIDSTRMGIAGHSHGGFNTNYILTHSNRFAAVFEGAGGSDWVSAELQLVLNNGMPRLVGQSDRSNDNSDRIWREPARYLENPILHVDKVTSPLLMFHCKKDGAVPFEQAVELFTALWRLGKKAWLLQYDEGDHSLLILKDQRDLTVRATQFFDYYLKGVPPPMWMTRGVCGELKGIETGLEPDISGRQP